MSYETMANTMLRWSQISGIKWNVSAAEKLFLCKLSVASLFIFSEIKAYHNEKNGFITSIYLLVKRHLN